MKSLAIWVAIIVVGLGVYQYLRGASDAGQLEMIDRCQQIGERFVKEIRATDKQVGIPAENRDFGYRSHYNKAERKCFVLTEGQMGVAVFGARLLSTQIWDVNAGVGATAVAERDIPLSTGTDAITRGILAEGTTFYRGQEKLPAKPETIKWFENLMIQ